MRKIKIPEFNAALFRDAAMDVRLVDLDASGKLHEIAHMYASAGFVCLMLPPRWFNADLLRAAQAASRNPATKRHMREWATLRGAVEAENAERAQAEASGRKIDYEYYLMVRDLPGIKDKLIHCMDNASVWWLAKNDAAVRSAIESVKPKPRRRAPRYFETRF